MNAVLAAHPLVSTTNGDLAGKVKVEAAAWPRNHAGQRREMRLGR